MRRFLGIVLGASIILAAVMAAASNIPALSGRINDNAGMLSASAQTKIMQLLKAHEDRTGNQMVVLTVSTLEGANIEEYAEKVFQSWKLGQKKKDNGILLVVSKEDRRMRFEVGYGLEGTLPDSLTGSIIRNVITPKFKTGDYDGGIEAGVNAVLSVLQDGKTNFDDASAAAQTNTEQQGSTLAGSIVGGLIFYSLLSVGAWYAYITPRFGWFLFILLAPLWWGVSCFIFPPIGAIIVLLIYLFGFGYAKYRYGKTARYQRARGERKRTSFFESLKAAFRPRSRRWSSDSDDSSSSSSSDYSGGGGSSGGAGSSGSW